MELWLEKEDSKVGAASIYIKSLMTGRYCSAQLQTCL